MTDLAPRRKIAGVVDRRETAVGPQEAKANIVDRAAAGDGEAHGQLTAGSNRRAASTLEKAHQLTTTGGAPDGAWAVRASNAASAYAAADQSFIAALLSYPVLSYTPEDFMKRRWPSFRRRSNRSRFITLFHAAIKSRTNFS